MKIFLRHSLYRALTISRLLNSLGSYIYNLVFVIYAASLPYSNLAVFIANMITIVPTVFTFWIGVRADRSVRKGQTMIVVGVIQAALFSLVSFMIQNQTFLAFSAICLINIVTDVLSDYASGLRMPILQHNLDKDDLFKAYSFTQFVSYLSSILGQSFGVWLLTVSNNNFPLVATINALSFLLSSLVLLGYRHALTHKEVLPVTEKNSLWKNFKKTYQEMELVFKNSGKSSFVGILLSILALNSLGGSIGAIYNFYFLHNAGILGLGYGQSLLIVEIILLVGAILGSLTPNDYFSKQSLSFLLIMNSTSFLLTALSNLLGLNPFIGLSFLAFSAYIMGKSAPKLDALIMEKLPADMLAQGNNFLGLLFTLSIPLGTFGFSSLALYHMSACWMVFVLVSILSLYLTVNDFKKG